MSAKAIQKREGLVLVAILLIGAALRLWGLDGNGFANTYYSAAVRSMAASFHNFLFVSFDPSGFVSVDKPPLALWIQTAAVKLFGFRPLAFLVPQALEGIACVAIMHRLVRKPFGAWAALLAAACVAISPIWVAVDRYNNVDSCLLLMLLLSAWAFTVATEKASRRLLLCAAVLVGAAFNAKMLAAFVVLPTFYLLYFVGARLTLKRRLVDLALASVVLTVVSLSWVLFVDLTPPAERPYVGSSADNSMMSLSLGWNGFQRLLKRRPGRGGHGADSGPSGATGLVASGASGVAASGASSVAPSGASKVAGTSGAQPEGSDTPRPGRGGRGGRGGGMGGGTPGPLRLAQKDNAGQVSWMFPLCLMAIGLFLRKGRRKLPLNAEEQAVVLWAGWLFTYAVVLSFLRGSMHIYYLVMLAPPLAALTGIGAEKLWQASQAGQKGWNRRLFPLALMLTAVWQLSIVVQYPSVRTPLGVVVALGLVAGAVAFGRRWRNAALLVGLSALFVAPLFWSLTPLMEKNKGVSPEAGPSLLEAERGHREKDEANTKRFEAFLLKNHRDEPYLVAAVNVRPVASIVIDTGQPVMAVGGFSGRDPILTVDQFAKLVSEHRFRYMLLQRPRRQGQGQVQGQGSNAREAMNAELSKWVRSHGKPVETTLWRLPDDKEDRERAERRDNAAAAGGAWGGGGGWGRDQGLSNMELFDLGS